MGDRGGNHGYVVQAGDSYEKIAGKLLGNQRAFGDLMRANGGVSLQPGMVIKITPRRKDGDYFVSSSNVATANAAGKNSSLPQMQQYGDYQANYKAAIASGLKGVGGSSFQGTGMNGGVAGATPGTPQAGAPNWGPQSGGVIGAPSTAPAASLSGRDAANAWLQQDAANKASSTTAAIAKGNAIEQGLPSQNGTAPGGTPTPFGAAMSPDQKIQAAAAKARAAGIQGINGTAKTTSPPLSQAEQQINPNWKPNDTYDANGHPVSPTPATPTVAGNLPPNVQAQADQQYAALTVQAIAQNKNVPMYLSPGQSAQMMTIAEGDPKLMATIGTMYSFDPVDGSLHAKGTGYAPGTASNYDPMPDAYNYSNTPPRGYNSQSNYSGGGRRGGGGGSGGGHRPPGYRSNDYSLGLGQ